MAPRFDRDPRTRHKAARQGEDSENGPRPRDRAEARPNNRRPRPSCPRIAIGGEGDVLAATEPKLEDEMKVPFRSIALLAAGAALTLSACADPQAVGDIKASVERIEAQQKDIVTKLDALDKSNKDLATKVAAGARPAAANAPDPNKKYDITVGTAPAKGPSDAPVTIVEWSDFQCPFCGQAKDLVHQIIDAYPKDVRFVFKNYPLPFHPNAMPAAKAA